MSLLFGPGILDRALCALPGIAMLVIAALLNRGLPLTRGAGILRALARQLLIVSAIAGAWLGLLAATLFVGMLGIALEAASVRLAVAAAMVAARRDELEFHLLLGAPEGPLRPVVRLAHATAARAAGGLFLGGALGCVPAVLTGAGGQLRHYGLPLGMVALCTVFLYQLAVPPIRSLFRGHRLNADARDRLRHGFRISEGPPPPFAGPQVFESRPEPSEEGGFPTIN